MLDKPTNLKVTSVADKDVTLSWNVVDGAIGYRVDYSELEKDMWTQLYVWSSVGSCTINNLKPDTEYVWQVTSLSDFSSSKNSESEHGENFTTTFNVSSGTYELIPNDAFWETSYGGAFNPKKNELELHGTKYGVSLTLKNGTHNSGYINDSQTRVYDGYSLQLDAPEGFSITKVQFSSGGEYGESIPIASVGTMTNNKNWSGAAASITISFKETCQITKISVTYAEALPASISSAGYATFVPSKDVTVPSGVTAYAVNIDGEKAKLTPVDAIPANMAVVLKGGEGTYYFPETTEKIHYVASDLKASNADVNADGSQYILANGDDGIGFYQAIPSTTIAAGKAYLLITTPGVKSITFEEVTAIDAVATTDANAAIYNLRGQRVSADYKGIVIKNGKKYLNK